jgi:hypothetical protein
MPGLLRGAARTAVVAGTATAVSGRVQRRQAAKFADRDAQTAAQREAAYQQQVAPQPVAPAPTAPPPAPAGPQEDMIEKLQRLSDLRTQGLLTDEEFTAAKAALLGTPGA